MNLEYLRSLYFDSFSSVDKITGQDQADRNLNIAYLEVYRAWRWENRKKTGQIVAIPRYTTGTCSITKYNGTNESAAKTVSFSGSTLTDSMRGRYLRVQGSSNWHKIVYINGSSIYLDTPIIDVNTGSGLTFEIWKRFYYVKSDAESILDFGRWADGKLTYDPDLINKYSNLSTEGTPSSFSSYGIDPYDDATVTGSLTIAVDSNVAIGSGTTWLSDGYDTGDIIQISNTDYYIKRIETDTRMVLFNYFKDAIDNQPFTLRKNNPIGFEFYNPSDNYMVLPYTYLGRAYPLVHPIKDKIMFGDKFIPAILSRALYYGFKNIKDERYNIMLAIYTSELQGLKSRASSVKGRYNQFSPKVHPLTPGRT